MSDSLHRKVMGQWATGVAVVTSSCDDGYVSGCTANAVSSVSLRPPLVLVCLGERSRTLAAVRRSRRFALSFLAANQEEVAGVFASDRPEADKFAVAETFVAEGVPVLTGCVAYASCRVASMTVAGDHEVVIGEVRAAEVLDSGEPLLFHAGSFRGLLGSPGEPRSEAA
jgi:flavin reductase (DIM6/NTAB) family NADH-FMN oxidoreductase RutF